LSNALELSFDKCNYSACYSRVRLIMKDLREQLMLCIGDSEIANGDKLAAIVDVLCIFGANTIGNVSTFKYFVPLILVNLRTIESNSDIEIFNNILEDLYDWLDETEEQPEEDWLQARPISLKYH
jgi:hypothetical protein